MAIRMTGVWEQLEAARARRSLLPTRVSIECSHWLYFQDCVSCDQLVWFGHVAGLQHTNTQPGQQRYHPRKCGSQLVKLQPEACPILQQRVDEDELSTP
jgi:hypothetical protein